MSSDADHPPIPPSVESNGHDHTADSDYVIAHVLFLDIVGFTKLVSGKQRLVLKKLQEIVWETKEFSAAQNREQLIALATGDGMALVFLTTEGASSPAKSCAEKIAVAVKDYNQTAEEDSKIKVRMGINTGTVIEVRDINHRRNVAGVGINLAQRVMDCGDAGHILLSQQAWDQLPDEQKVHCRPFECDVVIKHGHTVRLHNLLYNGIGNEETPMKIRRQIKRRVRKLQAQAKAQEQRERLERGLAEAQKKQRRQRIWMAAAALALITVAAGILIVKLRATQPPSTPSVSLAVLPFQPAKPEERRNSSRAISDGLTEQFNRSFKFLTTIKPLSNVKDILNQKPSGQPDSPQPLSPLDAGKRLKVRYVLTGTAEAYNDDPSLENITNNQLPNFPVDVHVVLYDTEAGKPVWESPDKSIRFDQLIDHQKEIIKEVTDRLGGTMRKQENPDINEEKLYAQKAGAYWYYLQGRFWSLEGATANKNVAGVATQRAILSYQKAIQIDENYAQAHAGLADVYNSISGNSMRPQLAKEEALKATKEALNRGEAQAEVYAAVGTEKWWLERDYAVAKIAFLLALKLQPEAANSYKRYSSFLAALGEETEAAKQIDAAIKMEPESAMFHFTSGQNFFFARDYKNAITELSQVTKTKPLMISAHRFLALAYELDGNNSEALKHLPAINDPSTDPEYSDNLGAYGYIHARMKDINEALATAQKMEQLRGDKGIYISPYNIALIYAEMPGREKDAFRLLDEAIREFDPRANWLKVDPRLGRLKQVEGDKFKNLLQQAGLLP